MLYKGWMDSKYIMINGCISETEYYTAQFWNVLKAHTLPFDATWKRQTWHFSLISHKDKQQMYLEFVVSVHQVSLISLVHFFRPTPQKEITRSKTETRQRLLYWSLIPLHWPGKWLSRTEVLNMVALHLAQTVVLNYPTEEQHKIHLEQTAI